jgi:spore germination cell wall hydrolase CwlJ-like protein
VTDRQRVGTKRRRAIWFALVVVLPVLAVSAKAAVVEYYARQAHTQRIATTLAAYRADPAALAEPATYTPDPNAAPAAGTTGTIDISALAVPANAVLSPELDGTVRPALPFSMNGASATDRARALDCLSTAIYYEAASESDDGQRAVAQVILNRVRHPAFPNTVCGVIYQGSERATGCQFSYACDGAMARPRSAAGMARATRIASAALNGYVFGAVGLATHYHTYAVTPAWNRALVMTDAIGAHFFHRWKGYWGTAAAFSNARYHGGEPVPGPYRRVDPLAPFAPPAVMAAVATAAAAPAAQPAMVRTDAAAIQPGYRDVSLAKPAVPSDDKLPPASQILDRWKDSGTPLR